MDQRHPLTGPARKMLALSLLASASACTVPAPEPSGRAIYAERCAACHGAGGRGDGPLAAQLTRPPADLTRLSIEWRGFPRVHVMGYVDGYFRDGEDELMPRFGEEMAAGVLVPVDIGDGVATPTPRALVALADYVESLQSGDAAAPATTAVEAGTAPRP